MIHTEDGGPPDGLARREDGSCPRARLDTGVEPGDVNSTVQLQAIPITSGIGEFGVLAARTTADPWHQQTTPIESTLFGLRFSDAQHGFAVGLDSVILRGGWRSHLGTGPPTRPGSLAVRRLRARAAGLDRR
jgi:hypothetical protein